MSLKKLFYIRSAVLFLDIKGLGMLAEVSFKCALRYMLYMIHVEFRLW